MSRFVASHRTSQSVRWKKDHYAFDRHRRFADVFAQLVAMAWLLVLGSSTGAPDQRMLPVIPMLVLIVIAGAKNRHVDVIVLYFFTMWPNQQLPDR